MIGKEESPESQEFSWEKLHSTTSEVGHGASCTLVDDNTILFFGGKNQVGYSNDIWLFDLRSLKWSRPYINRQKPEGRMLHTACLVNKNKLIVYGGTNDYSIICTYIFLNIHNEGNTKVLTWDQLRSVPYSNRSTYRYGHTSHFHQNTNNMYVFGGLNEEHKPTNSLLGLNLSNYKWSQCKVTGVKPTKRSSHCSVLIRDTLYVFGGEAQSKNGPVRLNDLHLLNLFAMKWESLKIPVFTSPKDWNVAANVDNMIYIFGRSINEEESELLVYNIKKDQWNLVDYSGNAPQPLATRPLAINKQNQMFLFNLNFASTDVYTMILSNNYLPNPAIRKICKDDANTFLNQFKNLFNDRLFVDIIFEVEQEEVPAHKAILASRSDYFRRMFTSGMIETQSSRITIPNVKPHIFKAIIEFIYCNELALDESLAADIIPLIDEYLLNNLKNLCEIFLSKHLRNENVVEYLIMADKHDANKLKDACLKFIIRNISNIYENEEILKLSKPLFVELLVYSTMGSAGSNNKNNKISGIEIGESFEKNQKESENSEEEKNEDERGISTFQGKKVPHVRSTSRPKKVQSDSSDESKSDSEASEEAEEESPDKRRRSRSRSGSKKRSQSKRRRSRSRSTSRRRNLWGR